MALADSAETGRVALRNKCGNLRGFGDADGAIAAREADGWGNERRVASNSRQRGLRTERAGRRNRSGGATGDCLASRYASRAEHDRRRAKLVRRFLRALPQ